MPRQAEAKRSSYHHGDLARALVEAATRLAEEGGPDAVVLREVARRTGVSATAAYRHFQGQEALLAAVGAQAMMGLSEAMLDAQNRCPPQRDPGKRALARWRATGEGYVRYAQAHPGLFRTAFTCLSGPPLPPVPAAGDGGPGHPYQLLCDALDDCVTAGLLTSRGRIGADQLSWIAVHGLAALVLDGALPGEGPEFERLLQRTLDLVARLLDR